MPQSISEEEKSILDTLRSVAKTFGATTEYRAYRKRILEAKRMAVSGTPVKADKEIEFIQTRFSRLYECDRLLHQVYTDAFNRGYNQASMYVPSFVTFTEKRLAE